MNENDLIHAFRSGHIAAFDYIYKSNYKPLCYFTQHFVHDREQAEDIVVESFIKLLDRPRPFNSLQKITSFLYTVTRNECFNYLKHLKRKNASHQEILHLMQFDHYYVESKIIKADLLRRIVEATEMLPVERKKIFELIFFQGWNTDKIAIHLNISPDTVRVQKARALHFLRKKFQHHPSLLLVVLSALA